MRARYVSSLCLVSALLCACPGEEDPPSNADASGISDAGLAVEAGTLDAANADAAEPFPDATVNADAETFADATADAGSDSGVASCIDQGYRPGERYLADDNCNFCDCLADGTTSCTARNCTNLDATCDYNNLAYRHGERFPSTDGCNDCVCATSGLACTRRVCQNGLEEGAILLETLAESCGPDPTFTAQSVLDGVPYTVIDAPFLYDRARSFLPESLPDSRVHLRFVYDGGYAVCRIPAPGQEAIDMEVIIEWITEDGSFREGFRSYLRRNAGGFTDAWFLLATAGVFDLDGSYVSGCIDPRGYAFSAQINRDGSAYGDVTKVCEGDIALIVGTFEIVP